MRDLYGKTLYVQEKSDTFLQIEKRLNRDFPQIHTKEFPFYDVGVFNECTNNDSVLIAFDIWSAIHPLVKIMPVEWEYEMPFGILHSLIPFDNVKKVIKIIRKNYN